MKFAIIALLGASNAIQLNRTDYHEGDPTTIDKIWGHLDDEVVFHDSGVHFDKVGFSQANVTKNSTANLTSNATSNISANATKNVSANATKLVAVNASKNATANASKNATGIADESYESNVDNRKASITDTHKSAEAKRNAAVGAEEASNAWRGVKPKFWR